MPSPRNWRDLINPRSSTSKERVDLGSYGKFTCEPLERGYGITSATASAGAARSPPGRGHHGRSNRGGAPRVHLDPGGRRRRHRHHPQPQGVRLSMDDAHTTDPADRQDRRGPRDRGRHPGAPGVRSSTPTSTSRRSARAGACDMEMSCRDGPRLRRPPTRTRPRAWPIGTIPIDALFSPIRKVNYRSPTLASVSDRLRQADPRGLDRRQPSGPRTPWPTPPRSSRSSSRSSSTSRRARRAVEPGRARSEPALNENLFRSVDELELSVRSANCLQNANIQLHRRAGAEDRSRDAQDQELRPQVPQGDQGNPCRDGPLARHEDRQLAADARALEGAAERRIETCSSMPERWPGKATRREWSHATSQERTKTRTGVLAPPRHAPQHGDVLLLTTYPYHGSEGEGAAAMADRMITLGQARYATCPQAGAGVSCAVGRVVGQALRRDRAALQRNGRAATHGLRRSACAGATRRRCRSSSSPNGAIVH